MVGNGHPMSVAVQVLQHVLGATEGWFGVDHPVLSEQWSQPGSEDLGLSEEGQMARKVKLAVLGGGLETGDELAAKNATEDLDGKKEARA